MENNYRCWKLTEAAAESEQKILRIGEDTYTLQDATGEQVREGTDLLYKWYVERKYKTQVAGLGRVYYEMRSEFRDLSFEELIFNDGECIGICRDGLVFLFDDGKTHYQQKYLGSVPISADQEIDYYDYYYLHTR